MLTTIAFVFTAGGAPSAVAQSADQHVNITKLVVRNIPQPMEYTFDYDCRGSEGEEAGTAVFDDPAGTGGIAVIGPLTVGDGECTITERQAAESSCSSGQRVVMTRGVDSSLTCTTVIDPPPPTEPPPTTSVLPNPAPKPPPLPVLVRKAPTAKIDRPPLPLPSLRPGPAKPVVGVPRLTG